MCTRLKNQDIIDWKRYGNIFLTEKGNTIGSYLLWRHNILEQFLKKLNQENFHLEQVEKIEHFIDDITLKNIAEHLKRIV